MLLFSIQIDLLYPPFGRYVAEPYGATACIVEHNLDVLVFSVRHKLNHKLTACAARCAVRAVGHHAKHLVDFLFAVRNHVENRVSFGADAERRAGVDAHARVYLPRF